MTYARFLPFVTAVLVAGTSSASLAAPVLLAEASAFYGGDSFSDSDGPVVATDPGTLYLADAFAEDDDGFVAAGAFGDTLGGLTLFETDAYALSFGDSEEGGGAGATSTFTLTDTITNTGAFADTAFLSFHIDEWYVDLEHTISASSVAVSAEILVKGSSVWSFTAGIDSSGGSASPYLTGFGPGPLPSQTCESDSGVDGSTSCYNELPYTGLLDLGLLAPGESIDFTYVMSSTALLDDIFEDGYADAYISDPTEGFFAGVGPLPGGPSSVPAPGALVLTGFGLVGFAYTRRKSR